MFPLFNSPEEDENVEFELPEEFSKVEHIGFDTETTGLDTRRHHAIGISLFHGDIGGIYIPVAHDQGFNFDKEVAREYLKDTLRGKHLHSLNMKFDAEMLRNFGVDLEEIGAHFHEVQHQAALLNANRSSFSLNSLALQDLGKRKIELVGPLQVWERSSESVSPYAINDAALHWELAEFYKSGIEREGLQEVLDLEDRIIPAVMHMQREGSFIDVGKAVLWNSQVQKRYVECLMDLWRIVGFRVEPKKRDSMVRLFSNYEIELEYTEESMKKHPKDPDKWTPSFTGEILKKIDEPAIQLAVEALQLASLQEKLVKILEAVDSNGNIRYDLHQMRSDEYGAITGRFSSSGGGKAFKGINIQQQFNPDNQLESYTSNFIIRELFVPPPGLQWLSVDAAQIEFRLFGHYSGNQFLLDAYEKDPHVDFHSIVAGMVGQPRKQAKHTNFGILYGMGIAKLANRLGVDEKTAKRLRNEYHDKFPAAKELAEKASNLAKQRGYVRTHMGRRRRFGSGIDTKYHAAINAIIQGTAAELMKIEIDLQYQNRKETQFNMRNTVHDELNGDCPDFEHALKVKHMLNKQKRDLKVPILWEAELGKDWFNLKKICRHDIYKSDCETCK
jgi:DNA polymerase I